MATYGPRERAIYPTTASANLSHAPAANTAAVVTLGGSGGSSHVVGGVVFSYSGSGTLAGGSLTIASGSTTVMTVGVESKGVYQIDLMGLQFGEGAAAVFTLAAGSANVTGALNVVGHRRAAVPAGISGRLDFSQSENAVLHAAL
jgi:hypothetical protein